MERKRIRKTPKRLSRSKYEVKLPNFGLSEPSEPLIKYVRSSEARDVKMGMIQQGASGCQNSSSDNISISGMECSDDLNSIRSIDDLLEAEPFTCDSQDAYSSENNSADEKVFTSNRIEESNATDEIAPKDSDVIPEDTEFLLSKDDWLAVYPSVETSRRRDKLQGKWTTIFVDKIKGHIPECVFACKSNRVRKRDSRKKNSPFFRGKAVCTRQFCSMQVDFLIKNNPEPRDDAVTVSAVFSGLQQHPREAAKRQLRGTERTEVSKRAKQEGVMNYYYDRVGEMDSKQIQEGNITHCQTPSVLRKAVSQWVQREVLHHDTVQEILLLKEAFLESDVPLTAEIPEYSGYIHHISADPFCVIMFGKDQLRLISHNCNGDLFFDATGSVMKNIPNQKMSLLYSLVLQINGAPSVSIADMLSTSHTIPTITHFLMVLKRATASKRNYLQPRKVETDWSWAIIQSCLIAFNNMNVKRYLNIAWRICHGFTKSTEAFTVLHICCAHITKNVFGFLKNRQRNKNDKCVKKFVVKTFVMLCNATEMEIAKRIFADFCRVLLTSNKTDVVEDVVRRTENLEYPSEDTAESSTFLQSRDDLENMENKRIHECSPFYEFFNDILQSRKRTGCNDPVNNIYYDPAMAESFTKKYMSIFPLWSGLLLGQLSRYTGKQCAAETSLEETRASNAPAEAWFKTVKVDILRRQTRLRPALLITKLRRSVSGRIKEIDNSDILRPIAPKRKRKDEIETSVEQWSKRKRTKHHPPKQSKSKDVKYRDIGNEANKSNDRYPAVPKWGGECVGKLLSNTCTLDNFLAIVHVRNVEVRNFSDLCRHHETEATTKLLTCLDFMKDNRFSLAKLTWISDKDLSDQVHVDLYGSEFEIFVDVFAKEVRVTVENTCSNQNCLQFHRQRKSTGIHLSASPNSKETGTIDGMVKTWITPPKIPCTSQERVFLDEDLSVKRSCQGVRSIVKKIHSLPPILVLTVSDVVQLGHLETDVMTYSKKLSIGKFNYSLAGVTLHKVDHFVGAVNSSRHGWLYYDGLEGYLKPLNKSLLKDCIPSHAIYTISEQ